MSTYLVPCGGCKQQLTMLLQHTQEQPVQIKRLDKTYIFAGAMAPGHLDKTAH